MLTENGFENVIVKFYKNTDTSAQHEVHLMTSRIRKLVLPPLLLLVLFSCSSLPSEGPSAIAFTNPQYSQPAENQEGFIVLDLDPRVTKLLRNHPKKTLSGQFPSGRSAGQFFVGKGDSLGVTIWEASSGGLFSAPSQTGASGTQSIQLPTQEVDRDGTIAVPYAGRINVAGLPLAQVEQKIVSALAGKAIEPQAIVTLDVNSSNAVTVSGDVISGSRIALTQRGERILDVIALAGGARSPVHETHVTLTRGAQSFGMSMLAIVDNPSENIFVRAGDTITLTLAQNSFSALGATGTNALVNFDAQSITLEKAVAKAGGLINSRSDPVGVFILRREAVSFARLLDPSFPLDGNTSDVNVVYRANLRDPNTLFLARRFAVLPDDILYIAGSPATEWAKFLSVIGLTGSTVKSVGSF
ncbi:MAG: polysaccharide biosynthesis/export family protein [Paracoccaceae bacterium]